MKTDQDLIKEALDHITQWAGFDGAHHKQYALDQTVRILTRCPKVSKTASDCRGKAYTYEALGESGAYREWVREFCNGDDGPDTYEWDVGLAP